MVRLVAVAAFASMLWALYDLPQPLQLIGKAGVWDGILNAVTNVRKLDAGMLATTNVRVRLNGACAKRKPWQPMWVEYAAG